MSTSVREPGVARPATTEHDALSQILAGLAGAIAAVGSALTAYRLSVVFTATARTGAGGVSTVAAAFYETNWRLIIPMALAATLTAVAGVRSVVTRARPSSTGVFVGGLVALAASSPAALVWWIESLTLGVAGDRLAVGVAVVASQIAKVLVTCLALSALLLVLSAVVCLTTTTGLSRRPISSRPTIAVLTLATVALLGTVILFFARTMYLSDVAVRGAL